MAADTDQQRIPGASRRGLLRTLLAGAAALAESRAATAAAPGWPPTSVQCVVTRAGSNGRRFGSVLGRYELALGHDNPVQLPDGSRYSIFIDLAERFDHEFKLMLSSAGPSGEPGQTLQDFYIGDRSFVRLGDRGLMFYFQGRR